MSSLALLECKKICLFRCLNAVALSIGMQFLLLAVFLLCINVDILHPITWIAGSLRLVFSIYTWLTILPLIGAVIIYGILLGKAHLSVKRFNCSRLQWFVRNAPRKFAFLGVHLLVGLLTAWLYTRFLCAEDRTFFIDCFGSQCINSRYMFLLCAGIAAGCVHFMREHLCHEPKVIYPLIQESKLVQIRSLLYTIIYRSLKQTFVPNICFTVSYWLFGGHLNERFAAIFNVEVDELLTSSLLSVLANVRLVFYAWILSSQILSNMQLMQRFFSIMLGSELQFIIEKNPMLASCNKEVSLVEALTFNQLPVIQSLAALDLYNISVRKFPNKRWEIFALSVPGGHPYNWNQLSAQCLCLINAFTEELTAAVTNISSLRATATLFPNVIKGNSTDTAEKILLRQYNERFCIRRLMMPEQPKTVEEAEQCKPRPIPNASQRLNDALEEFQRRFEASCRTAFHTIPGLFYLFGEPDGAKTVFLLSNSQPIVWLCQGLAGICSVSLLEDKYGVVQNTLPAIIKALLKLKMQLDKLNNVNLNGTKLDRNLITLRSAVKRSLYQICTVFGDYMRDLLNDTEDLCNVQGFLNYQET